MESTTFDGQAWLEQLRAVFLVPTQITCRTTNSTEGSVYDYFAISTLLATKVMPPKVHEAGGLPVHLPVHLPILNGHRKVWLRVPVEPKQMPKGPHIGCSRPPSRWDDTMQVVLSVSSEPELRYAWDLVLSGIEAEI